MTTYVLDQKKVFEKTGDKNIMPLSLLRHPTLLLTLLGSP
jgi:hypothetical protein